MHFSMPTIRKLRNDLEMTFLGKEALRGVQVNKRLLIELVEYASLGMQLLACQVGSFLGI
jgi:hypothetical protein